MTDRSGTDDSFGEGLFCCIAEIIVAVFFASSHYIVTGRAGGPKRPSGVPFGLRDSSLTICPGSFFFDGDVASWLF